jgi:hypothetical protein
MSEKNMEGRRTGIIYEQIPWLRPEATEGPVHRGMLEEVRRVLFRIDEGVLGVVYPGHLAIGCSELNIRMHPGQTRSLISTLIPTVETAEA